MQEGKGKLKGMVRCGVEFGIKETETRIDIYSSHFPVACVTVSKPAKVFGIDRPAHVSWVSSPPTSAHVAGEFALAIGLGSDMAAQINLEDERDV